MKQFFLNLLFLKTYIVATIMYTSVNPISTTCTYMHKYWAKVLPEQWELIKIFRKHEIFRRILGMHFEQAIIHLSKSLNFNFIQCFQITSFVNVLEVPTQNIRLQK